MIFLRAIIFLVLDLMDLEEVLPCGCSFHGKKGTCQRHSTDPFELLDQYLYDEIEDHIFKPAPVVCTRNCEGNNLSGCICHLLYNEMTTPIPDPETTLALTFADFQAIAPATPGAQFIGKPGDDEAMEYLCEVTDAEFENVTTATFTAEMGRTQIDVVWEDPRDPKRFVRLRIFYERSAVVEEDEEGGMYGRVREVKEFEFYLSPALVTAIKGGALENAYQAGNQDAIDLYWLAVEPTHPTISAMGKRFDHMPELFSRFPTLDLFE